MHNIDVNKRIKEGVMIIIELGEWGNSLGAEERREIVILGIADAMGSGGADFIPRNKTKVSQYKRDM